MTFEKKNHIMHTTYYHYFLKSVLTAFERHNYNLHITKDCYRAGLQTVAVIVLLLTK